MQAIFNHLLTALCISDLLVILSNSVVAANLLYPENSIISIIFPWSDALCHVATASSVFFTISITIERYYAVCSPLTYQARVVEKGSRWILWSYIIPCTLAAAFFNVPKIVQLSALVNIHSLSPIQRNMYIKFGIIYQVFHPLFTTCIIPILILSVLNYKIVLSSKRVTSSISSNDISLSKIMMTLVMVFIILNIPRTSLLVYEASTIPNILDCHNRKCPYFISSTRWLVDSIIRYLVMLTSSVNFIIYCFVGSTFRTNLFTLLGGFRRKPSGIMISSRAGFDQSSSTQLRMGMVASPSSTISSYNWAEQPGMLTTAL